DRLQRRVGGDHHHLDGRVALLDMPQDLEPVHLRHLDVEDDEVRTVARHLVEPGGPAVGGANLVDPLQQHAERLTRPHLVVDDEDARPPHGRRRDAHTAAGSLITNATSCRPWRSSSRPPIASTMRWLTAGPMSIRFSCTMRTGSKIRSRSGGAITAVREPMTMRATSGPSDSVRRPIAPDTEARSGE